MTQIEDLQARLAQALERIGASVDGWQPPATPEVAPVADTPVADTPEAEAPAVQAPAEVDESALAALREELEDEKLANAQLEERLRVIKDSAPAAPAAPDPALTEQLAAQKVSLAALDGELQRLRSSNDSLREVCEALRVANAKGAAEPHLINKALLAELESLRAARSADAAEVQAVMGALGPLMDAAEKETA